MLEFDKVVATAVYDNVASWTVFGIIMSDEEPIIIAAIIDA